MINLVSPVLMLVCILLFQRINLTASLPGHWGCVRLLSPFSTATAVQIYYFEKKLSNFSAATCLRFSSPQSGIYWFSAIKPPQSPFWEQKILRTENSPHSPIPFDTIHCLITCAQQQYFLFFFNTDYNWGGKVFVLGSRCHHIPPPTSAIIGEWIAPTLANVQ